MVYDIYDWAFAKSQMYTETLKKNLVTSKQIFLMNFLADPESLQNAQHANAEAKDQQKKGPKKGQAQQMLKLMQKGKVGRGSSDGSERGNGS